MNEFAPFIPEPPENYFPVGPPEGVPEGEYQLFAWQPANDQAERKVIIHAYKGGEKVGDAEVRMSHPNIFGIDAEDMMMLDQATDRLMESLKQ